MLTRDLVKRQLVTYQKAWQQQDADTQQAQRLAGLHAGIYPMLGEAGARRVERTYAPKLGRTDSDRLHQGWLRAVERIRS